MGKRILINASNLHVGGGIQVAASFISEISRIDHKLNLSVWVSKSVAKNLESMNFDASNFACYEVIDSHGWSFLFSKENVRIRDFDLIFTVFGPLYSFNRSVLKITGFAQGWLIYPKNEISARWGRLQRLAFSLKSRIQKYFFASTDIFVVELGHVRQQLIKSGLAKGSSVEVVHNCVSSIFFTPDLWRPVAMPETEVDLKIGFLGRNYPHKNTSILPQAKEILFRKYGINAEFIVTFRSEEWDECNDDFKHSIQNIGELSLAQCPSFYAELDAVVFPSLLECFSATPLEAMLMRKPLFASDRAFNRDICGNHAFYFDPLNPESLAQIIFDTLNRNDLNDVLGAANFHAGSFSSSASRTTAYLKIMQDSLN